MEIPVAKWGNSMAIRLPKALMKALSLGEDARFEVVQERGGIFLRPISRTCYDLDTMLAEMTPQNRHDIIDDSPRGSELF